MTKRTENELFEISNFEKWFKESRYNDEHYDIALSGWNARSELTDKEQATIVTQIDAVKFQEALDAMCVDKDKQIAELQKKVQTELKRVNALKSLRESYEKELEHYRNQDYTLSKKRLDIIEQSLNSEREMNETLTNENLELQAQINELRAGFTQLTALKFSTASHIQKLDAVNKISELALAKTAPQCLQEHDNEVIEKCAKVCDEYVVSNIPSNKIRALKHTS